MNYGLYGKALLGKGLGLYGKALGRYGKGLGLYGFGKPFGKVGKFAKFPFGI